MRLTLPLPRVCHKNSVSMRKTHPVETSIDFSVSRRRVMELTSNIRLYAMFLIGNPFHPPKTNCQYTLKFQDLGIVKKALQNNLTGIEN